MTELSRDVAISGGKGTVVGDYNEVFQFFGEGPPALSSYMRTSQFRSIVDDRTRNFVGRDFVFEAVDRQLGGGEMRSGYLIIRGEPGIGKTAVAAMLVLRRAYVHHFNVATANIRSPRQFLENVCAQLIVRYGLDHKTLPPQAGEDGGFLSQLLAESADRAREQGSLPVVIVVDALDEVEDTGVAPDTNRLFLPRTLPDGVFFVVTTREEADYRLDVDEDADIWIGENDPENKLDITRYVETFVDSRGEPMRQRVADMALDAEGFATTMLELSEGNFMYLVHVLADIAAGRLGSELQSGVKGLPRGLKGYYQRHWRDMKAADQDRFEGVQRPVLCFLAISREPVSVPQLMDWTQLDPAAVTGVIDEWRQFLNEDDDVKPALYRLYHRSFAEFLDEEENLQWYHGRIADAALAKIPGFV